MSTNVLLLGSYLASSTVGSAEDWACSIAFVDALRNPIALTGVAFTLTVTPVGLTEPIWTGSTTAGELVVSGSNTLSWVVLAATKAAWTGSYLLALTASDGTYTKLVFAPDSTLQIGAPNALTLMRVGPATWATAVAMGLSPLSVAVALAQLGAPDRLALAQALLAALPNAQADGGQTPPSAQPFVNADGYVVVSQ